MHPRQNLIRGLAAIEGHVIPLVERSWFDNDEVAVDEYLVGNVLSIVKYHANTFKMRCFPGQTWVVSW